MGIKLRESIVYSLLLIVAFNAAAETKSNKNATVSNQQNEWELVWKDDFAEILIVLSDEKRWHLVGKFEPFDLWLDGGVFAVREIGGLPPLRRISRVYPQPDSP